MPVDEHDPLAQAFRAELEAGETLLWTGRPAQGIRFRMHDILLVPFTVLWAGFAFFWEISVLIAYFGGAGGPDPMPVMFPIFGIPFCLAGLYLTLGRFLLDRARRRRTFYAVTDRRAIITSLLPRLSVKSYYPAGLDSLELSVGKDGSGSITLERQRTPWYIRPDGPWLMPARHEFEWVDNVREPYALLLKLRS